MLRMAGGGEGGRGSGRQEKSAQGAGAALGIVHGAFGGMPFDLICGRPRNPLMRYRSPCHATPAGRRRPHDRREPAAQRLRLEGHAVDWVRDAAAADGTLASERFDLVLLDLGLPRSAAPRARRRPGVLRACARAATRRR